MQSVKIRDPGFWAQLADAQRAGACMRKTAAAKAAGIRDGKEVHRLLGDCLVALTEVACALQVVDLVDERVREGGRDPNMLGVRAEQLASMRTWLSRYDADAEAMRILGHPVQLTQDTPDMLARARTKAATAHG